MSQKPVLSHRRLAIYNRLCQDVAAMTYVVRFTKQTGSLGPATLRTCRDMAYAAFKLYRREPGIPHFNAVLVDEILTLADLAIFVTRLSAAGAVFEERYAHYTEAGIAREKAAARLDADGLPSKHA